VQFSVGSLKLGSPVQLVDGVATSRATKLLPPGATTVTATYSGDRDWSAAQDSYRQRVTFQITITAPASGSSYKAGATVPIRFTLSDAVGNIPDIAAIGYLLSCGATVSADGAQTLTARCPTGYDPKAGVFSYSWKTAKGATGDSTVKISVRYPNMTEPQTSSTLIILN
jgi:hypothetical protein